jgi:hypothetical protein
MSFQHQTKKEGSARMAKPHLKLKMLLYVGMMMLLSCALYLVAFRGRVSNIMQEASSSEYLGRNGETEQNVSVSSPDTIQVIDLPAKHIPKTGEHRGSGRLIIVGDVHGMLKELTALLDKVQFDLHSDHLVLAGDMIAKGPDSLGVVDLAMRLGATAVRGNHEDRILHAHAAMSAKEELFSPPRDGNDIQNEEYHQKEESLSHRDSKDRALATLLGEERIQWLKKCPIILRVGNLEDMGEIVVVHAGLEPGVALQDQDLFMAMNMRTISKTGGPSDKSLGDGWMKVDKFLASLVVMIF